MRELIALVLHSGGSEAGVRVENVFLRKTSSRAGTEAKGKQPMAALRKYVECLSRGRRTDRIAYALKEHKLPKPIPGAEWQRIPTFNATEEVLADPTLKEVFKTAVDKGVAVIDRPENRVPLENQ
jgi:hypothetical protein